MRRHCVARLRCCVPAHDDLMVVVINSATLSPRVRAFHFADAQDWHANDAETSLMLAWCRTWCAPI